MFKLEDRVRPFCHKILMVIVPMLVDEDNYARVEGREIVASLAKAAGLATMIQTMKDDLSNPDDYVLMSPLVHLLWWHLPSAYLHCFLS